MKEISIDTLYYEISRHNPPALSLEPGESVRVETQDTFNGLVQKQGDRRDLEKQPNGNPQSGPIFVEGAEKGDTLAIYIDKIEPRTGQAANDMTWARFGMGEFLGLDIPVNTRIAPIEAGKVWWSPTVALPYRPMIGTIGCAPEIGVATTGPAGDYGGNMDLREVTEGNTLYLPVFVEGALLHLGDTHAIQGAGELCGTAMEMPGIVTIRVDLIKRRSIPRPRLRNDDQIMTVATGRPMERSVNQAYADLILWMEEEFGVPRWDGLSLCTMVGEISLGWQGLGTIAAKIDLEYVRAASRA